MQDILETLAARSVRLEVRDGMLHAHAAPGAMTQELQRTLLENKDDLIRYLSTAAESEPADEYSRVRPDPDNRHVPFALNPVQHAYWIGRSSSFALGGTSTHVYFEFECEPLDGARLSVALDKVVARHEMLRAIVEADGRQRILEHVDRYRIAECDLTGLDEERRIAELERIRKRISQQVIACERWPLFEICIVQLSRERSRLCTGWDFLTLDAWSLMIVLREWHQYYVDSDYRPEPLTLTFRDYLLTEIQCREHRAYRDARQYWLDRLENLPGPPSLPQAAVVTGKRYELRRRSLRLGPAAWQSLRARAHAQRISPSTLLLAAFAEVLGFWSADRRFCVNLTLFNRLPLHEQVNRIVGDFTNLMLVEIDADSASTFVERAERIQEQCLRDMEHRQFGATEVMREIVHRRRSQQAATFPVVFTSTLMLDGSRTESSSTLNVFGSMVWGLSQTPQVSLDCQIFDVGGELLVNWDAAEELFEAGVLNHMFTAYEGLLNALALEADSWGEQQLISLPASQRSRRDQANATQAAVVSERLHEAFVRHALMRPSGVAVECGDRSLTYGELLAASDRLASQLIQRGVVPNQLVGICIEKSLEQIVGVLAVLIAGGAYLPIDPRWPTLRRDQLLIEGDVRVVLSLADASNAAWPEGIENVAVRADVQSPLLNEPPTLRQSTADLAYVIFTSGSTGTPKGVMVDHAAALNTVFHINRLFGVDQRDRVLGVSELSFDLSVYDIFGILGAGATLVLPEAARARDPRHWHALIRRSGVTVWNSAPQLLSVLVDAAESFDDGRIGSLRMVLLSGDWIPTRLPSRVRQLATRAEIISLGGATEGSIWSIYFPIEAVDPAWSSIPYGKPLPNQHMYVLDAHLQPRPDWVAGDLYIGGAGVAAGYWKDAEKTARRFIRHPQTNERLYLTGDKGRYRHDGVIEFLGREDQQVKVRGYRVELGEISATLLDDPRVSEALVRWLPTAAGNQLVAYAVVAGNEWDASAARQFLEQRLPDYMVPQLYIQLDEFPLTANGKVDVQALPSPAQDTPQSTTMEKLPRSEAERAVWRAWAEVLGRQSLRVDENFFDAGGDSLRLIDVMNRLNQAQALQLSVSEMLSYPTIESLAAHLEGTQKINASQPPPSQASVGRDMDIAIIGMAGRFPDAADVDELWRNVAAGRCSVRQFTDQELLSAGVSAAEVAAPNYVKAGPVLPDIDLFDADYFELSPAEAAIMDPQQRMLLECATTALENAGYPAENHAGRIGVFAGKGTNFYLYEHLIGNRQLALNADMLAMLSLNEPDYAATLVSYKLNLTGPSISIHTACSTSLVAVHAACQSLIGSKECEIAIAGGATLASTVTPSGYLHVDGHITSPDGYCRAFGDDANGVVFGSGVGFVVLKPLQRALEDRDTIYAVIKGSAINNDGSFKLGFTAPSARGQASAIADALRRADCSADSIQAIEAHGTGTNLGDPVEVEGLRAVFGGPRESVAPCAIGSIKTNIGHLGAAAGVAGLIKMVQALRHRQLPPTLHADVPNRKINFRDSPFYVSNELRDWPAPNAGARRASVSSFGVGGTNAHVIVEEAPQSSALEGAIRDELLVLSGRSASALSHMASNLAAALRANPSLRLEDVSHTLQMGRRAHEWRASVSCRSIDSAIQLLDPASLQVREYKRQYTPQVDLLCSGEGLAIPDIRDLCADSPAFNADFVRCIQELRSLAGFDLRDLLQLNVSRDPLQTRALQFASEFALASLWRSLGIRPAMWLGFGLGQIVADCVSGVLSLREALARLDAADAAAPAAQVNASIEQACSSSEHILLSLGTQSALPITAPERHVRSLGQHSTGGGYARLLASIGELWMRGVDIDWRQLHVDRFPRRIPLPTYPFERQRHWIARSAANRLGPAALLDPTVADSPDVGKTSTSLVERAEPGSTQDVQAALKNIWAGVLGVPSVEVSDNFFDLGGNSIMATRLLARVRRELEVELPISRMFELATMRQMCLYIVAKRHPELLDGFSEEELQELSALTED